MPNDRQTSATIGGIGIEQMKYEYKLPNKDYVVLATCLYEYTQLPEDKRPELLRMLFYQSLRYAARALYNNFILLTDEYHYGNRVSGMHRGGRVFRFNLTGAGAEIIEWWMSLGFDSASISKGEWPPQLWDVTHNEKDYHRPSGNAKTIVRVWQQSILK